MQREGGRTDAEKTAVGAEWEVTAWWVYSLCSGQDRRRAGYF
jgi:hypothetical protein